MSAQRKLFSAIFTPLRAPQRLAIGPRSRSIAMTSRISAPPSGGRQQQPAAAENVPETSVDPSKPVPSEQIPEEAKKQEPDAGEQIEEMKDKGLDPLPTQT